MLAFLNESGPAVQDRENTNNGRLVLGVASLAAVVAMAVTVWAVMRRRSQGGAQPGADVPDGDPAHSDAALRAQRMSGSSQ